VGFGDNSGSSAIDVLERKNPVDFESATTDNFDAEREKMHRNLNRLLYGETEEQDIAETENFISSDRGKMTDKFIEQVKNGPNRRGMKRADGKDAGAPARKKAE